MKTPKRLLRAFLLASCMLGATGLTAWKAGIGVQAAVESKQLGPIDVSIIQLIATPEKYDGKLVRAIGFVRLEFEGNVIYLHQEDLKHGLTRNGLWLNVPKGIQKEADKYNDQYVLVVGTFNAREKGHMGMTSGAIEDINRFQVWDVRTK
jgi:hypothetical protein